MPSADVGLVESLLSLTSPSVWNTTLFKRGLAGMLALYFLPMIVLYLGQDEFVFQPQPLPAEHTYHFPFTFEELWLEPTGGPAINAIWARPESRPARGVVLYFHGNRDHLERWGNELSPFLERDYAALAIDYRGYGKSEGDPTEEGLYQDGMLAYRWAVARGYRPEEIVLYGRSLGSGVATYIAARADARLLILETPYNSIEGAIESRLAGLALPFSVAARFPNEEHLKRVDEPVRIFHGTNDQVVPYASARRLQPVLKPGDRFFSLHGADHHNVHEYRAYLRELDRMLR